MLTNVLQLLVLDLTKGTQASQGQSSKSGGPEAAV